MKKKIVILLAAVAALSMLGGCGEKKDDSKKADKEEKEIVYDASKYVTLGEYKGLEVSLESYEVTDEAIRASIEELIANYPVYTDSDKAAVENGDFANIDYEGLKDGVAFDGGTEAGRVLEIGSGSFIPGFEEGLVGAAVGATIPLNITFPEDYQNTEMAGAAVVFNVTVNKIVNKTDMTVDTLTDDYVKTNFSTNGFNTVDEFKAGVKKDMEESNAAQMETDTMAALAEKLSEVCKVKSLPEGLLDQKVKIYKEQMAASVQATYGMTLEEYLEVSKTSEEDFNTQITDIVKKQVEGDMILQAIAKKEKIKADKEGFAEYKKGVVSDFGYENEEALLEQYGEAYVENVYITTKAQDLVKENAKITFGEAKTQE